MALIGGGERDLTIKLFANVSDFQKNIKKATNETKTFAGISTETLKKVGVAVAAAGAVVAGFAVKLGVDSVKAAIEAQKQQERLAILLRNTGGATEAQIQTLNAQAVALGAVGVATRDNVTITQSQLATFDLKAGTIAKLTPAILDYVIAEKGATASTDDFKSMTNGLAQALQGNFASLTRTGFVLDEATKATIANGTETERTAALVEVLNSTYEGFNATVGETAEGQLVRLQNAFEDVKLKIGEALLPFVLKLFEAFRTHLLPKIVEFADFIVETVIPAIEKFGRFLTLTLIPTIRRDTIPAIEKFIGSLKGLKTAFGDVELAAIDANISFSELVFGTEGLVTTTINAGTRIVNVWATVLDVLNRVRAFISGDMNTAFREFENRFKEQEIAINNVNDQMVKAYTQFGFYNSRTKNETTPLTKDQNNALKDQNNALKDGAGALDKSAGAARNFAGAQNQAANAVKQLTALQRELNALQAGGAIPSALSPDMTAFYKSELSLIRDFGGLIGGINLNPDDPFFGFGQGGRVNEALRQRAGGSATATGGVTINVTGTVIDPEGAARAIEQLIIDSNARGGELIPFGGSP
jgi:hypothetical protein